MQNIELKDYANSQKRSLFNLKSNFNKNGLNLNKLKNTCNIGSKIFRVDKINLNQLRNKETLNQLNKRNKFDFKNKDLQNKEPNWRSLRVSTTRHSPNKLSNLSFIERQRSESTCSMEHIQKDSSCLNLNNLMREDRETYVFAHRRIKHNFKDRLSTKNGARYLSEKCSALNVYNPEEGDNTITTHRSPFKCVEINEFGVPRKTAYFGCVSTQK